MEYTNFDIETLAYKEEGGVETFKVRVRDRQTEAQAEPVTLRPEIRNQFVNLVEREFKKAGLIQYGKWLGEALLPSTVRTKLRKSLGQLTEGKGLRIRLILDTYALAELPWEYLYLPDEDTPDDQQGLEGFLALNPQVSITRFEVFEPATQFPGPVTETPARFVACFANPPGTDTLDLEQEKKNIDTYLDELGNKVQKQFIEQTTPPKLQDAFRNHAHIFHFAGHGEFKGKRGAKYGERLGDGVLLLEDGKGGKSEFTADKLRVTLQGKGLRLVVLGACKGATRDTANPWSGIAPALVRAGIPAVVGMQFKVGDENAVHFSRGFYAALAKGSPIDTAMSEGRKSVYLSADEDERDWGTPVLYLREDGDDVRLFPATKPADDAPQKPPIPGKTTMPDRVVLRNFIIKNFAGEGELDALCDDITHALPADRDEEINMGLVGGSNMTSKALNLIQYCDRRGWLGYLVDAVKAARPDKAHELG